MTKRCRTDDEETRQSLKKIVQNISLLPVDTTIIVFTFLDETDVYNCLNVDTSWYQIITDPTNDAIIWKPIIERRLNYSRLSQFSTYFELFKSFSIDKQKKWKSRKYPKNVSLAFKRHPFFDNFDTDVFGPPDVSKYKYKCKLVGQLGARFHKDTWMIALEDTDESPRFIFLDELREIFESHLHGDEYILVPEFIDIDSDFQIYYEVLEYDNEEDIHFCTNIKINSESELIIDNCGKSKIGGYPDLPEGLEWPENTDNEPLWFFCQLNLGELSFYQKFESFPNSGMLYIYMDFEEVDCFYLSSKVIEKLGGLKPLYPKNEKLVFSSRSDFSFSEAAEIDFTFGKGIEMFPHGFFETDEFEIYDPITILFFDTDEWPPYYGDYRSFQILMSEEKLENFDFSDVRINMEEKFQYLLW